MLPRPYGCPGARPAGMARTSAAAPCAPAGTAARARDLAGVRRRSSGLRSSAKELQGACRVLRANAHRASHVGQRRELWENGGLRAALRAAPDVRRASETLPAGQHLLLVAVDREAAPSQARQTTAAARGARALLTVSERRRRGGAAAGRA